MEILILKNVKCCSRNGVQREHSFARRRGAERITATESSTRENVLAMEKNYFVNIGARSKYSNEININWIVLSYKTIDTFVVIEKWVPKTTLELLNSSLMIAVSILFLNNIICILKSKTERPVCYVVMF